MQVSIILFAASNQAPEVREWLGSKLRQPETHLAIWLAKVHTSEIQFVTNGSWLYVLSLSSAHTRTHMSVQWLLLGLDRAPWQLHCV